MGLRCSLLGHDYGEPEREAEQERRGDEMVVTTREFRRCARCGAETVVSENTEVTTVGPEGGEDAADPGDEAASTVGDATADEPEPASPDATADLDDPAEDDAVILDDDGTDGPAEPAHADADEPAAVEAAESVETADQSGTPAAAGDDPTADRETAHAADDPASANGADAPGEADGTAAATSENGTTATDDWPEADDVDDGADDDTAVRPWPESEGEDEGFDAEPGGADEPAVEFGGLTPEEADLGEDGEGEFAGDDGYVGAETTAGAGAADDGGGTTTELEGAGITSAGPVERTEESVDAVLVCPECGFSQGALASSLRAGDICPAPDCGRGYLTERQR